MMYKERFVVAVKVNGQVLRESGDSVALPFGSEYSLLLKNLESRRAQVSVEIDGTKAITDLIVPANGSVDLERFVNDLNTGNRFKFIAKTKQIEKHRGNKPDDGLVRVEFQFEKQAPVVVEKTVVHKHEYWPSYPYYWPYYNGPYKYWWEGPYFGTASKVTTSDLNNITYFCGSNVTPTGSLNTSGTLVRSCNLASIQNCAAPAGITVPGSQSNQQFLTVSGFPLETQKHVIVLRLVGQVAGKAVAKPITTKSKLACETCGKKNRAGTLFCPACGTAAVNFGLTPAKIGATLR